MCSENDGCELKDVINEDTVCEDFRPADGYMQCPACKAITIDSGGIHCLNCIEEMAMNEDNDTEDVNDANDKIDLAEFNDYDDSIADDNMREFDDFGDLYG